MGTWHIFRREVQSYFQSFIAYVIISAFLLLAGYFFYTDLIMYVMWTLKKVDFEKIWELYFNDIRYMMTIIMPLITMRLFAEEKKLGTIELLWTYPLRDWELFAGKYLSALLMLVIMLGLTLTYPAVTSLLFQIDLRPLFAGYLGLFLMGSAFIICGVTISILTENQIVAALGTYLVLLLFWFLTWNEAVANPDMINILLNFSLFDRLYNFTRGAIDLKDVVFFINFHLVFAVLALLALSARKWRGIQ